VAQDFNQYTIDKVQTLISGSDSYTYGVADIVSDINHIPVDDESFDHVLCSEVLEHVPKPVDTIRELARVLRPNGTLILTAPMNCLRHFDPFFFTSGLSDNWYKSILPECGLEITVMEPVGDYYSWMKVELFRNIALNRWNPLIWVLLLPGLVFFATRRKTAESTSTLCMGYHLVARKLAKGQISPQG
jgi:ubiquinone/menaquinone biosynthesis C-methylase UbiE